MLILGNLADTSPDPAVAFGELADTGASGGSPPGGKSHTGGIGLSGAITSETDGQPVTTENLKLPAFRALFCVGE